MQQVFIIHGGNAFDSYDLYLKFLREIKVTLEDIKTHSWKSTLQEQLGPDYDVLTPHFPNRMNAKYLEWKIWFEKYIPLFDENLILVGHSLGGIFLAKYLSEETYPKRIRGTFLVAAPFATPREHPLADFNITHTLHNFAAQGGEIFLYHSQDDHIVPFSNMERYREALPAAHVRIFEDRRHFNSADFPEIVDDIRSLTY